MNQESKEFRTDNYDEQIFNYDKQMYIMDNGTFLGDVITYFHNTDDDEKKNLTSDKEFH